jgi:hypothetical protein
MSLLKLDASNRVRFSMALLVVTSNWQGFSMHRIIRDRSRKSQVKGYLIFPERSRIVRAWESQKERIPLPLVSVERAV